jgi:Furry protein C-terminal
MNFFQNLHGSYSDSEVFCKKELAGRTMEFSFDVSQTPLIGRRLLLKPDLETNVSTQSKIIFPSNPNITGTPNSPRRSTSLSPADTAPLSGWKRPWMSQSRVRECLVNLLTTCGQRVGLPKSPSVSIQSNRRRAKKPIKPYFADVSRCFRAFVCVFVSFRSLISIVFQLN